MRLCHDAHVPPETQKLLTPTRASAGTRPANARPGPDGGYLKTEKVDGIAVETGALCDTPNIWWSVEICL